MENKVKEFYNTLVSVRFRNCLITGPNINSFSLLSKRSHQRTNYTRGIMYHQPSITGKIYGPGNLTEESSLSDSISCLLNVSSCHSKKHQPYDI